MGAKLALILTRENEESGFEESRDFPLARSSFHNSLPSFRTSTIRSQCNLATPFARASPVVEYIYVLRGQPIFFVSGVSTLHTEHNTCRKLEAKENRGRRKWGPNSERWLGSRRRLHPSGEFSTSATKRCESKTGMAYIYPSICIDGIAIRRNLDGIHTSRSMAYVHLYRCHTCICIDVTPAFVKPAWHTYIWIHVIHAFSISFTWSL
jgi:hypothetical protein